MISLKATNFLKSSHGSDADMKLDKFKQGSGSRFLDLFDRNMKSRKKFSTAPDLSDQQSKQKRSSDINMPITQFHPSKADMSGGLIYGKAPGLVARLMGLDSLPTSSSSNTHSNRSIDSKHVRKKIQLEQKDLHKIDRKEKVMDKFQTESLPPKSAKPVPVPRLGSSRKPLESNAARSLKGQSMNKSWDGCLQRKPLSEQEKKSISSSLRSKNNVKKIQGSTFTPKKPSTNIVLKQNNQKQNCKPAAKSPVKPSNIQSKRDKNVRSSGSDVVSFTFTSRISRAPTSSIEKNLMFKDEQPVFSKRFATMEVERESESESEPRYVNDVLFNIKSMFEEFALGRTHKIVNPRLYDLLEAKRQVVGKAKLRRKLVFDCVSECVDSRCGVLPRGLVVVRRKKWLVKEVCEKILGWEGMKDCMVDELVDKDMSSDRRQKWVDFDVEAFEVGGDIERRLLDFLINEAVVDILVR